MPNSQAGSPLRAISQRGRRTSDRDAADACATRHVAGAEGARAQPGRQGRHQLLGKSRRTPAVTAHGGRRGQADPGADGGCIGFAVPGPRQAPLGRERGWQAVLTCHMTLDRRQRRARIANGTPGSAPLHLKPALGLPRSSAPRSNFIYVIEKIGGGKGAGNQPSLCAGRPVGGRE